MPQGSDYPTISLISLGGPKRKTAENSIIPARPSRNLLHSDALSIPRQSQTSHVFLNRKGKPWPQMNLCL